MGLIVTRMFKNMAGESAEAETQLCQKVLGPLSELDTALIEKTQSNLHRVIHDIPLTIALDLCQNGIIRIQVASW
jgi:hypothetical protein